MTNNSNIYLSVTKVAELLGVSASTIWRWTRTPGGAFPQPVRLSAGCTRWKTSDVLAFAAGGDDVSPLSVGRAA
jgi:prophage regulatory protein